MDVYKAIADRRSIRAYEDRPIPEDVLARVLEAARLAPSAKNRQEWRFIVVRDAKMRQSLAQAAKGQDFVAQAPVCLVFCATERDYTMSCGQKASSVDVSIAMAYVTLAAVAEGLGTCWLGAFYEDQVRGLLGIPSSACVVAMAPLGYPAESPAPRLRKSVDRVVGFEKW